MLTRGRFALGAAALVAALALWLLVPRGDDEAAAPPGVAPVATTTLAARTAAKPERSFSRVEVTIGSHVAIAFASQTRIGQHLKTLDRALIGRLDLYAHARPGTSIALWEDDAHELVAAALDTGKNSRFLVGHYSGEHGAHGWYDATGRALKHVISARPVPLSLVTSGFGRRLHPISGKSQRHSGVDYGARAGTPVSAVAPGRVRSLSVTRVRGIALELAHDDGYISRYFHMQGLGPGIAEGVSVRAGQTIGFVGSTGRTTGPHLHFELLRGDARLNPADFLPASEQLLEGEALREHQALLRQLTVMPEPTNEVPAVMGAAPNPPSP
jgi:murein DD-endopeptidase MepM/ murein hydrolase activator NlpD